MRIERPFLVILAALALLSSACSTVIKPTRPDVPFEPGPGVTGFRFDGDRVDLREPGMPLSSSRAWQREVGNYTATKLNALLSTSETAPPARTVVTFDLASPSAIQIGTWKEMTIELTTVLPGGQVVRSKPVTGNIDSPLEHFAVQGMAFTGSALDVGAAVASILYFVAQAANPQLIPVACGCMLGSLIGGLALNIGQSVTTYFVAGSEEVRWSNLFAKALKQHAEDVRVAALRGPVRAPPLSTPLSTPPTEGTPPSSTPPVELPPDPGTPPPPPLLDPADDLDRQLEGGGGGAAY